MASVGPVLLLLLICSSFLLSSQQAPPSLNVNKKDVKDAAKAILEGLIKIEPLISLIPKAGPYLSAILRTAKNVKENNQVLSVLNSEFNKLNHQLQEQLITMTWHSWASGPFQEVELDIRLGWTNLNQLVEGCKGSCKKQQFEDLFNKLHTSLVFAPDKLYMLLTSQQPSFIVDFKTLLTDQFRCHESSINDFAQLIAGLMYQGNTVGLVYYSLHGVNINKADEMAQMMFESFSVMASIHKHCITNPDEHIKKDVFELIDENQDRQQLAKEVKNFLATTYDRYNWLVVAFLTKNSKHTHWYSRWLNRHLLSGFMEVTKGDVSVAVAKQVKGKQQLAKDVSAAVAKCIDATVKCKDVIEKLEKCKVKEDLLSKYYTAVHVYRDESHDSEEEEAIFTADEEDSLSAYVHTGHCGDQNKNKKFRVLIKSDEELKGGDLCKDVNCGGAERGKCVRLVNIPKVMCECNTGFYGSNCDISLQDLKEALRVGTIRFSD